MANQLALIVAAALMGCPKLVERAQLIQFDNTFSTREAWTVRNKIDISQNGRTIEFWAIEEVTCHDVRLNIDQLAYLNELRTLKELNVLDVQSVESLHEYPRLVELAKKHVENRLQGSHVSGSPNLADLLDWLGSDCGGPGITLLGTAFKNKLDDGIDPSIASLNGCNEMPLFDAIQQMCDDHSWKLTIEMQGLRITKIK